MRAGLIVVAGFALFASAGYAALSCEWRPLPSAQASLRFGIWLLLQPGDFHVEWLCSMGKIETGRG